MTAPSRDPLHGRRAAGVVFGLFVAVGLIIVFGSTLARSTDVEAQAAQLRAEVERARQEVADGLAEIEFLGSERFILQQARAEGLGIPGEKRFSLPEAAPSPAPVPPIGSQPSDARSRAPFDAWMDLLFGD